MKTLSDINNDNKSNPPRTIICNNKVIYRLSDICNIANTFYIDIIKTIRGKFRPSTISSLDILTLLIPRTNDDFTIPLAKTKDIMKIIDKMPNSLATGHDDITMTVIKKCKYKIVPKITHFTN